MQIRNCVINKSRIFSASVSRPRVDSEPVLSIGEPMFTLLPARFFQRIGRGGDLWPPFRTGSGRERCPISHHHFRIGEPRVEDDVCGSSRDSEPPNVVLSNDDVFFFQGRIFGKSVVLSFEFVRSVLFSSSSSPLNK